MTFRLNAIEMKDFKCYYGNSLFEFPVGPGLYYLTGRNDYNPRLGANGVGKSSLLDALEWCLYGKTSRGLRANDVISWGKKSSKVSVSLTLESEEVEITRTQKPNAILINGKAASQDEVTDLIRLNQEAFNAAIVMPQFGKSFFDLTPTTKLELFSQVMDLDFWMKKSKQAKDEADDLAENINSHQGYYESVKGTIEANKESLEDLKGKRDDHGRQVRERLKTFESKIDKLKADIGRSDPSYRKAEKSLKGASRDLRVVFEGIEEVKGEAKEVDREYDSIVSEMRDLDRHMKSYQDDIDEMEQSKGSICSTCKQRIDDKHVDKRKKKLEDKIKELEAKARKLVKKADNLKAKRDEFRNDFEELKKLRVKAEEERDKWAERVNKYDREIRSAKSDIKSYEERIKELKEADNPFDSLIAKTEKAIKKAKAKRKELKAKIDELKIQHQAVNYWINGFKRVRLYVIEEAVSALEIEINNLLVELGLVDWQVKLDVERETKAGNVTKGFTVMITSPKHDKPVRWEAWSGGEVQRLRMAGNLGLANLIMEQAGFTSKTEIIDEPSEHMSTEGIEDLLDTLHDRAHNTDKQIWLADHHTVQFGEFSGILTAVMGENGRTHLEYKGNVLDR